MCTKVPFKESKRVLKCPFMPIFLSAPALHKVYACHWLLSSEDLLLFSILCDDKVWIFGFWSVGDTK